MCRNGMDGDLSLFHIVMEVVELNIQVFCSRTYFRDSGNFDCSTVVFKNLAVHLGANIWYLESILVELIDQPHHGNGRP